MRNLSLIALLGLGACGWNHLPTDDYGWGYIGTPLWAPEQAVGLADGLYVPLTKSGGLARIATDGTVSRVDFGAGLVSHIEASPDGQSLVTFIERYRCDADPEEYDDPPVNLEDCSGDDLEVDTEIAQVNDGIVSGSIEVAGSFNRVTFSEDSSFAVAYLDQAQGLDIGGVVDLTSVIIIDLRTSESWSVSVGFAADTILFTQDSTGATNRAVMLSPNQVAVVDLTASQPEVDVTFSLTLDPDSRVTPVGIALTPDGQYALISIRESNDLYVLDLTNKSINIVELSGRPSAMATDPLNDQTILVYNNVAVVDLLDHSDLSLSSIQLDEPPNHITNAGEFALLFGIGDRYDIYSLDLERRVVEEHRLENPPISVELSPDTNFAIALTRPDFGGDWYSAHYGMEIVDLASGKVNPFGLEGPGIGLAFNQTETTVHALLLQENIEYLYQLDLYTREASEIEIARDPVAIGNIPGGPFWVTHQAGLGLVSFVDPSTGEVTEVEAFATPNLFEPIPLSEQEEN